MADKTDSQRRKKAGHAASNDLAASKIRQLRAVPPAKPAAREAEPVQPIESQNIDWIRQQAKQGHAISQATLGDFYRDGRRGVEYDESEALSWYLKAAKKGLARAQYIIGYNSLFVEEDYNESKYWLDLAANQEHADAQFLLANEIYKSRRFDDCKEVEYWYKRAATNGNADAARCLGDLYSRGYKRIEQNDVEALRWYIRAV